MNIAVSDGEFLAYLRQHVLPIRSSQYDITNTCNLTCEGCLFFSGDDYKNHPEERDLGKVDLFFKSEAARGVNYAYIAGAEPSLAEAKLLAAQKYIKRGNVVSNGTRRITRELRYAIHVSLWGLQKDSARLRGADVVDKQFRNCRDDPRVTFIYTINHGNVCDINSIAKLCADQGARLSFNHFSPSSEYLNRLQPGGAARDEYFRFSSRAENLILTRRDLDQSESAIAEAQDRYPETIVYDAGFSAWVHGQDGHYNLDESGLAIGCPSRLTKRFRHFNADLSRSSAKCCSPNIECSQCRLYIQSLATALQRPSRAAIAGGDGLARWTALWRLWCRLFLSE